MSIEVVATLAQAPPIITAALEQAQPIITAITAGPPGAQGPPGANGTPVVTVLYDDWPPASPDPDTLYLRLAP